MYQEASAALRAMFTADDQARLAWRCPTNDSHCLPHRLLAAEEKQHGQIPLGTESCNHVGGSSAVTNIISTNFSPPCAAFRFKSGLLLTTAQLHSLPLLFTYRCNSSRPPRHISSTRVQYSAHNYFDNIDPTHSYPCLLPSLISNLAFCLLLSLFFFHRVVSHDVLLNPSLLTSLPLLLFGALTRHHGNAQPVRHLEHVRLQPAGPCDRS